MKASDIPYIVIGLALLGVILYRQLQRRPIRSASNNRLPLILGVIGLIELVQFLGKGHHGATIYAALLGSLVLAAVFGAIRAVTTHVWLEGGQAWRQGNWLTAVLWVVSIAAHLGYDYVIDGKGAQAGLGSASLTLYLAVTLVIQSFILNARAQRIDGGGANPQDTAARTTFSSLPRPPAAPAAPAIASAPASTASAAAMTAVTVTVAAVVAASAAVIAISVTAGEQHRTHAGNGLSPGFGQQRCGRLSAVLTAATHPGRDQPGHDRRREGRPAPLRHAEELPRVSLVRDVLADIGAAGEGIDEVLAWRGHVDPAAVVAEVRAAPPVGRKRADRNRLREGGRPARPPVAVVPRWRDADDTLVRAELRQPGLEGQRRQILPGR